jgi:hypothetical protein
MHTARGGEASGICRDPFPLLELSWSDPGDRHAQHCRKPLASHVNTKNHRVTASDSLGRSNPAGGGCCRLAQVPGMMAPFQQAPAAQVPDSHQKSLDCLQAHRHAAPPPILLSTTPLAGAHWAPGSPCRHQSPPGSAPAQYTCTYSELQPFWCNAVGDAFCLSYNASIELHTHTGVNGGKRDIDLIQVWQRTGQTTQLGRRRAAQHYTPTHVLQCFFICMFVCLH